MVNGRLDAEVDRHIANASKALMPCTELFSMMIICYLPQRGKFTTPVYSSYFFMDLNVGQCCTGTVLKITKKQHTMLVMTREKWGDTETITGKIIME